MLDIMEEEISFRSIRNMRSLFNRAFNVSCSQCGKLPEYKFCRDKKWLLISFWCEGHCRPINIWAESIYDLENEDRFWWWKDLNLDIQHSVLSPVHALQI